MTRQLKVLAVVMVLALGVTGAAGCGSKKKSSASTSSTTTTTTPAGGGGGSKLKISADKTDPSKFNTKQLSAKAGKVTITMDNPSLFQHAVSIKGNGAQANGNTVGKGGVSTVSATLKPGTYEFYCPVDGHEAAGMKGTLTVK